jgi:hypothetical protein
MPSTKTLLPWMRADGSKPTCPASATSSSTFGLMTVAGVMLSGSLSPSPATPTPPMSTPAR